MALSNTDVVISVLICCIPQDSIITAENGGWILSVCRRHTNRVYGYHDKISGNLTGRYRYVIDNLYITPNVVKCLR